MRHGDLINEAEFNAAADIGKAYGGVVSAARRAFDNLHGKYKEAKTDVQQDVQQVQAKQKTAAAAAAKKAAAHGQKQAASVAAAKKFAQQVEVGAGIGDFVALHILDKDDLPPTAVELFDYMDIETLNKFQKSMGDLVKRFADIPDAFQSMLIKGDSLKTEKGETKKQLAAKCIEPAPTQTSAIEAQIKASGFGPNESDMWKKILNTISTYQNCKAIWDRVAAQAKENEAKNGPGAKTKDGVPTAIYPTGTALYQIAFCQWKIIFDRMEALQQMAVDAEKRPRLKDDEADPKDPKADSNDEDIDEALKLGLRKFLKRL